jgi:hypothetical protein
VGDYTAALALDGRDPREQAKTRLAEVVAILGDMAPEAVAPEDIERLKARLAEMSARGRKDPEDPRRKNGPGLRHPSTATCKTSGQPSTSPVATAR